MFGAVHPNQYAIKYGVEKLIEIKLNKYASDKPITAYERHSHILVWLQQ